MFDFLWLITPLLLLETVHSSYRLVKKAAGRFGKTDAEKLSKSPLIRWLWKRFGHRNAAVASWFLLSILLSGLIPGITKVDTFLLQVAANVTDENYAFFPAVGLTSGMVCPMTMRNRESLKRMQSGDLWIKKGIVCRRLDPKDGLKNPKVNHC